MFYSHVICLGTKMCLTQTYQSLKFYSHVICLGTKITLSLNSLSSLFYSHVICLGTKMHNEQTVVDSSFYSHVICLGTKISNLALPTFVYHHFQIHYIIFQAFKKAISGIFSSSFHLSFSINV
nr:MAG TPA: hypothetical protein [Caudoviricetes sp.]